MPDAPTHPPLGPLKPSRAGDAVRASILLGRRMPTRPDRPAATAERCKILIVGAGLAGLSAAYHLRQGGVRDVVLVEALHEPGGWATTDWDGPWGSDRGIHLLYFRDEEMPAWVEDLVGRTWKRYDKRALIDSAGVRPPFPYPAHLPSRPPEVVLPF